MKIVHHLCRLAAALGCVALAHDGFAADYYVDPERGALGAAGDETAPWRSLQEAVDRKLLAAGDTVHLLPGYHGDLKIKNQRLDGEVAIVATEAGAARLSTVEFRNSAGWRLSGLSVSPAHAPAGAFATQNMKRANIIGVLGESARITVENSEIRSTDSIEGWTPDDWLAKAWSGFAIAGEDITLRGNKVQNVRHGVATGAERALIENNDIENFSGDGIRGLGDHSTYRGNVVKNCYKVDKNHDDGFQSWSVGADGKPGRGEVVGGTVSGNTFINYEDADQPLRCHLMGISLFDGMFVDWTIENNLVVVDHWNGIVVKGGIRVRVVNNTVIDPNDTKPGPAAIKIGPHKNGRGSEDCVMANNLTPGGAETREKMGNPPGVTMAGNIFFAEKRRFFVDPYGLDLHLKADAPAIDRADPEYAPATDRDGNPRPQGAGPDVGAFEKR